MSLSFDLLIAIVDVLWLLSLAAGLLAIWFGCVASPRRFKGALGSAVAGLVIAFAGLNWFHFSFTKSTNDSSFTLDSKWFFLGTLGLAILGLALAFWQRQGSPPTTG
jgi:hypothetical protein